MGVFRGRRNLRLTTLLVSASALTFIAFDSEFQPSPVLVDVEPDNVHFQNKPSDVTLHTSQTKILIYAKHGTGSTFAWEFFNRHADVFSIFEPLDPLHLHKSIDSGPALLGHALSCDFRPMNASPRSGGIKSFVENIFCRPGSTNEGCPLSPTEAGDQCKKKKHVVSNVITQPRLKYLTKLTRDGLKVIHLVRDPRGIINSRKSTRPDMDEDNLYIEAQNYCLGQLLDLGYMRDLAGADPELVKTSYYLMRYEDIAMNPTVYMQKMYDFVGIEPDGGVWDYAKSQEKPREKQHSLFGEMYGTLQVSATQTALAWRDTMSLHDIELVQYACEDFMQLLGYLPLRQLSEQRTFTSIMSNLPL